LQVLFWGVYVLSLKAAARIFIYLVVTILLGCVLAPPLYWAGQAIGRSLSLEFLIEPTFQRYYHRAILIAAVALLWPLYKVLDLRGWDPLGLRQNPRKFAHVMGGFAAAFLLLFAMGLLGWMFEVYKPHGEIRWDKIGKGFLAALAVPPLEEWFFRCAILGVVLRSARPAVGVVVVSAIFSAVHFLKPQDVEFSAIGWGSGFALLPYSFHRFAEPLELLGGFSTLFAIGVVLAVVTLQTRSLWAAIGLHAGWIFGSRLFNILFKQRGELQPWFGSQIEVGLAPLFAVLVTGAVMIWALRGKRETAAKV
jgi:membrane protease YdiL (CAAX protease family)